MRPVDRRPETRRVDVCVSIEFDLDVAHTEAERRGCSVETVIAEMVGDCTCRLTDSIRWRDAVIRVGVGA